MGATDRWDAEYLEAEAILADQQAARDERERMYQGRPLRRPRSLAHDLGAALVTALLAVECYLILFLSSCWWGCQP